MLYCTILYTNHTKPHHTTPHHTGDPVRYVDVHPGQGGPSWRARRCSILFISIFHYQYYKHMCIYTYAYLVLLLLYLVNSRISCYSICYVVVCIVLVNIIEYVQ